MKGLLQRFVAQQVSWSAAVDGLLPQSYRLDGNRFFIDFYPIVVTFISDSSFTCYSR
jgi:hypothetical protein